VRILVCGDRHWTDEEEIRIQLGVLLSEGPWRRGESVTIIEGEQRGADLLARKVAEDLGLVVEPYPADWDKYGKAAGPIRNRVMLDEGKPDLVLAFHHDLSASKGTANMVKQARAAGVPVVVYDGGIC
jgi:hypothetical protein